MSTEPASQAKKLTFTAVHPSNPNINNILKTDNAPYIESNDFCIVLQSDSYFRPTNITVKNNYTYFLSVYCGTADHLQQCREISDSKLNNKQKNSKYIALAQSMQCYIEQSQLYAVEQPDMAKCTKVRQYKQFNRYMPVSAYKCMLIVCQKNYRFMTQSIGLQWLQVYGYEYSDERVPSSSQLSQPAAVKSSHSRKHIDIAALMESDAECRKRHKYADFKTSFQNEITTRMIGDVMGESRPE